MANEPILVVDDDENLRYLMSVTLKRAGYRVDSAGNGAEALDKIQSAKEDPYNVLVTDQMMPIMGGIELLKKAKESDPHLEVIVITAAGTLKAAISALKESGAFDYLLKPIESMNQLTNAVENASAHRKLLLEHEWLQNQAQIEAQRLKSVVACAGDAILSGSEEDIIKIANPAAEALLKRPNLVGEKAQDCLPQVLVSILNDWKAGGGSAPAVLEINWEGDTVQKITLIAVSEEKNRPQGWVMTLRDITHLKDLDRFKTKMLADVVDQIQPPLSQAMNAISELSALTAKDAQLANLVNQLEKTCDHVQNWVEELRGMIQTNPAEQ